jgi:hypothetical protein
MARNNEYYDYEADIGLLDEDEKGLEPNEDVVGLLEKASMPRRRWFAGQPQRLLRRDDETSTTVRVGIAARRGRRRATRTWPSHRLLAMASDRIRLQLIYTMKTGIRIGAGWGRRWAAREGHAESCSPWPTAGSGVHGICPFPPRRRIEQRWPSRRARWFDMTLLDGMYSHVMMS